jgi:transcriptional regulator with XRE-family HTH domain
MNTLLGFPEGNAATAFGSALRRWRTARGMSQMTLALEAGISARHLSVAMQPLVSMQLRKDDLSLAFFSTITTLGTPRDVMLQQLKIECFFPADTATEQTARRLAAIEPRPVAV